MDIKKIEEKINKDLNNNNTFENFKVKDLTEDLIFEVKSSFTLEEKKEFMGKKDLFNMERFKEIKEEMLESIIKDFLGYLLIPNGIRMDNINDLTDDELDLLNRLWNKVDTDYKTKLYTYDEEKILDTLVLNFETDVNLEEKEDEEKK